jgi:hypothetical protein
MKHVLHTHLLQGLDNSLPCFAVHVPNVNSTKLTELLVGSHVHNNCISMICMLEVHLRPLACNKLI